MTNAYNAFQHAPEMKEMQTDIASKIQALLPLLAPAERERAEASLLEVKREIAHIEMAGRLLRLRFGGESILPYRDLATQLGMGDGGFVYRLCQRSKLVNMFTFERLDREVIRLELEAGYPVLPQTFWYNKRW